MTPNRSMLAALAWIGAIAAVLVSMLVPLPRAVLSEEEHAAGRMPETRAKVSQARAAFDRAESSYRSYVGGNDVGAALTAFEQAVASMEAQPNSSDRRSDVRASAARLLAYMNALGSYASAGETYFSTLSYYDDELMAWTRSLGAESEALRSATWPIVEFLKLYPAPVGLKDDYTWIRAAEVMTRATDLQRSATCGETSPAQLRAGATSVRDAGRSVEYTESLHPQYEKLLREYDANLQSVIAARASTEPDARRTLATVLDVGAALLLALGIGGLLLPQQSSRAGAAQ